MSQKPLDLVVLMIGTNDLKFTDGYGAARGADCLVKLILDANHVYKTSSPVFEHEPRVLLIAPPVILPEIDDGPLGRMIHDGHRQSLLFAPEYTRVAAAHRIDFLDAAQYAVADPADCVHIGAASHLALGEAVAAKVRAMFAELIEKFPGIRRIFLRIPRVLGHFHAFGAHRPAHPDFSRHETRVFAQSKFVAGDDSHKG